MNNIIFVKPVIPDILLYLYNTRHMCPLHYVMDYLFYVSISENMAYFVVSISNNFKRFYDYR
jgi:hypothetical protein